MDGAQGREVAASEITTRSRRYFVCPYIKHAEMIGRPHEKVCPSGCDFESMAALKRHLNTSRTHNKKVQNCKRCKAYFTNSHEHASHEALRSCPSNPISKGDENLATKYRSLYKTLFPNSPVPPSPFNDCMSKEQYKAETTLNRHGPSAVQPTKATIQPSTIPSSTSKRSSSPYPSSAASSSWISQDASTSSIVQRPLSQRTEPTTTNLTPAESGSPTTSDNARNTQNVGQHDEAQVTFLERQILKHLSTIQGAVLQQSNSSTPETILVLQKLDAGLSELERLSTHTLRVSAEAPSPHANPTVRPEPAHSGGPTFSAAATIQTGDSSSTSTNVAPVSPQQPPTLTGEPGLSNESEGATSMNQQQRQTFAISSAQSRSAEEESGVNPETSFTFLSPRKRKRQRLEQNGHCLSTPPFLPFSYDTDLNPFPSEPQPSQEAVLGEQWDFAATDPNSFDFPSRDNAHLPGWSIENHFDDSAWQQLDLSCMELPLFRWDGGLEDVR